jgi:hypothetical protein
MQMLLNFRLWHSMVFTIGIDMHPGGLRGEKCTIDARAQYSGRTALCTSTPVKIRPTQPMIQISVIT